MTRSRDRAPENVDHAPPVRTGEAARTDTAYQYVRYRCGCEAVLDSDGSVGRLCADHGREVVYAGWRLPIGARVLVDLRGSLQTAVVSGRTGDTYTVRTEERTDTICTVDASRVKAVFNGNPACVANTDEEIRRVIRSLSKGDEVRFEFGPDGACSAEKTVTSAGPGAITTGDPSAADTLLLRVSDLVATPAMGSGQNGMVQNIQVEYEGGDQ